MIDPKIFTEEMLELQAHFDRKLSDTSFKRYHAVLGQLLTTDEFKKGVIWAYRYLKPHPSFFPSPQEMIEGAQGSIRDRAIIEWSSFNRSEIGRKAFDSCDSEDLAFRRKEFIENFIAFAKNAAPEKLQVPPLVAIAATKKKAYALPHPDRQTPEQKKWSIEQWESFLSAQEEAHENTSYAS